MKITSTIPLAAIAFAALTLQASAGQQVAVSKNPTPVAEYEGGRGLLTLEGPTGLFINPTSGTMPAHAFTVQYCVLFPNNDTSPVMAHGGLIAYGVTDWLELGANITVFDFDQDVPALRRQVDTYGAGPYVRVRLMKQEGLIPQISVGGYFRFGDFEQYNVFLAAYERFEISRDGFLRSIGLHAGIREKWVTKGILGNTNADANDVPVGYFGLEFQLPARFYVVGEISTQDRDSGGSHMPYAAGIQWRAGGINISAAFLDNGSFKNGSFYFGIGSQFKF